MVKRVFNVMFSRFNNDYEHDGTTDRHTDRRTDRCVITRKKVKNAIK